jgi:glycosyltransferase involved in cell wall biosynthesis
MVAMDFPPPPPADANLRVSVVIPCYNAAATLSETLDGLVAQEWDRPWEIVLADNGSTDASAAIFAEYGRCHPEIPMGRADAGQRPGQPQALNVGVRAARGEWILFCDADDVPAPGWLRAMAAALEKHAFVAARMDLSALNPDWIGEARQHRQTEGLPRLSFPPYCTHAGGGTIGFRRSLFDQIGEFDHALPAIHDTDFCVRAHLRGVELQFVPEAVMQIRMRGDMASIYRQAYGYAKYTVLLAKRYEHAGGPRKGMLKRVKRAVHPWMWLSRTYLAGINRKDDLVEQARYHWLLGWERGRLAGSLAFRFLPP